MWDLSCPDWEDRIRNGRSLIPPLPLFRREADLATSFYNGLCLPDVAGKPLMRDASGQWFREIVEVVFGSRDPAANIRYVPEVFIEVPKGNSKTTNGAALMLVALLMNLRPRAEFLFIGPTQAISELAFSQAVGMVQENPDLKTRFRPRDHLKEIIDLTNAAKLKIKTFSLDILTGPKPAGVMLDELHLLGKVSYAVRVLRQIRGGLEKISEGFLIITTTQSDERPAGVFRDELALARKIRDGRFKGRMLPVLYEFPRDIALDETKWRDSSYWPLVLPNLGRSLRLDSLIADFNSEVEKGEQTIQVWASQHLNIEIGLSLSTDGWAGARYWAAQKDPDLTLASLLDRCDVVTVGIDGGGLDDLLGLAVLGREKQTGNKLAWCRAYAHEIVFERRKSIAAELRDFADAGELIVVKRMEDAFAAVADIVAETEAAGLLATVGLDRFGVAGIVKELAARGIEGDDRVVGIQQGYQLGGTIKQVEVDLADSALIHADQAIMDWCVANAKVELRANGILITKQASGTAKIDPLMALFDAAALMQKSPSPKTSAYADGHALMVI